MELSDLAARVTALEERLGLESGLRASQDRDLSSLAASQRAQTSLIQALAITQMEHTRDLAELRSTLARHGVALDGIAMMLQTLIDRE